MEPAEDLAGGATAPAGPAAGGAPAPAERNEAGGTGLDQGAGHCRIYPGEHAHPFASAGVSQSSTSLQCLYLSRNVGSVWPDPETACNLDYNSDRACSAGQDLTSYCFAITSA